MTNNINHPKHYTGRGIGYECIDLTRHQTFCVGNVVKYLWRYRSKGKPLEDLEKARWYAGRASASQERATLERGYCEAILRYLIASTTGPERSAWTSLMMGDWRKTLAALDEMIKETQNESRND